MFLPYIYLIAKYSIIGIKEDVTAKVKQKEESVYNDIKDDLDKLFELNLISEDEYLRKKKAHVKEKIRFDLIDTEEYNLLLKSKQKGLLTNDEFDKKVENLIELIYEKSNGGTLL